MPESRSRHPIQTPLKIIAAPAIKLTPIQPQIRNESRSRGAVSPARRQAAPDHLLNGIQRPFERRPRGRLLRGCAKDARRMRRCARNGGSMTVTPQARKRRTRTRARIDAGAMQWQGSVWETRDWLENTLDGYYVSERDQID